MSQSTTTSPPSSPANNYARTLEGRIHAKLVRSRMRLSKMELKRKYFTDDEGDEDIDDEPVKGKLDYADYGRMFARLGEPFTRIATIVEYGLELENRDTDDEGTGDDDDIDKQMAKSWRILCEHIPGFKEEMVGLAEKRKLRRSVCLAVGAGVDHARADDTSGLKKQILAYLLEDISTPLHPPIQGRQKSQRGFSHPVTAILLTPLEWVADETTFADIRSGRKMISADHLPRFLYPENHSYNEEDIDDGLFQGHLLYRCAKHMYMGPAAALEGPGFSKGRAGVAKIIGMRRMTPRALAYVAIQVRFALSDAPEWSAVDRAFDYETFFWNLVELLKGNEGKSILDAYTHALFGTREMAAQQPQGDGSADGHVLSTFERVREQRKRRRLQASLSSA